MSRQKSRTRDYHLSGWHFNAIDNVKAKIQDKGLSPQMLNLLMESTMSRPKFKTRDYDFRSWHFDALTMSRQKSRTRDYHLRGWHFDAIDNVKAKIQDKGLSPWGWIFWQNWQCQGQNPGQGIITSEVEYSDAIDNVKAKMQDKELSPWGWIFDAIDNVKAKIQDKELSPQRLNLQMQLTMSRPKYKTRNHHLEVDYFDVCNWQGQGKNPGQGIITSVVDILMQLTMSRPKSRTRNYHLEVEYFDAIDNVKAKIQNNGSSPWGWIFWCNWQCQGQNPGQVIITSVVASSDSIHNLKPKIWHKELSP
jgi:hypothetical protein